MINIFASIKKDSFIHLLIKLGIVLFLGLIFIVNIFHFCIRLNSDIASDVVLTKLIFDSRQWCPSTWYAANELRIICTPNMAAFFYALTGSPTLAMGIACFVMTLAILAAVYYFMLVLGAPREACLWMLLLCLMLPVRADVLELLYLFASYYAIHVVALFLSLGIYIQFLKNSKWHMGQMGIEIVLAFILGLQGERGILVIYAPLFGMEILRNIYIVYTGNKIAKRDISLIMYRFVLLLVSCAGTLWPSSVSQGISRNFRKGPEKLFSVVIPDIWAMLGFNNLNLLGKICLLVLLAGAVYLLFSLLYGICRRRHISLTEWAYLLLWSSPAVTALAVAFTTVESSKRYYFVLIFTLALSVVMIVQKAKIWVNTIIIPAAVILGIINIQMIYLPIIISPEPPLTEAYAVTEYLEEQEIDTAYATFENANLMTVMAKGVRVVPVASVSRMDICRWMTSALWYVPNVPYKAETAYIVTDSEMGQFQEFYAKHRAELTELEQIGKYHIFESEYNFSNLGEK